MIAIKNMMTSETGKMFMSIILGFGLASLFSKVCNERNCLVFYGKDPEELKDKIVLIEGADPGYDWIFLHGIKGLITKYGGAASHMTIRCSEFDIPAAIGCGESIYETLKESSKIKINCKSKKIIII